MVIETWFERTMKPCSLVQVKIIKKTTYPVNAETEFGVDKNHTTINFQD